MRRYERVHERLEVRSPPLRECVANFPFVIDTFARELRADWGKALIEPILKTFQFAFVVMQIITGTVQNQLFVTWGAAVGGVLTA